MDRGVARVRGILAIWHFWKGLPNMHSRPEAASRRTERRKCWALPILCSLATTPHLARTRQIRIGGATPDARSARAGYRQPQPSVPTRTGSARNS